MKEGVHYTCKLCGRVYKTKGGCARHIREDHRFAAGSSPQQDEAEEESEELSSEEEDNLPVQYPTPITVYLDPSTPFGRARQIIQAAKRRKLGV
ncbi:hypothetical protein, conserved [Angomonas deanei]|uniref:C2H2-type domain-containing protein n=1 Tax=Angomonas deanei TaxID=59799 RepID=A0A7G2CPH7_9TRYP|nr:hypothetical protein, conserved [Angomonas deanei]